MYVESRKNITVRIETDEMRSYYHDKGHQIRLWRAAGLVRARQPRMPNALFLLRAGHESHWWLVAGVLAVLCGILAL
ncbi:MAG: hypothetical protein LBC27_08155 [Spirochaetaceae bacterium]|nr:hypothetical protein [Spirochaetaceae bacterium]